MDVTVHEHRYWNQVPLLVPVSMFMNRHIHDILLTNKVNERQKAITL